MELKGENLIAAAWSAGSPETFEATDPSTGRTIGPSFHEATEQEIDHAAERAHEALRRVGPPTPATIAELLSRTADGVERLGDRLVDRCAAETALPVGRLHGERDRTTGQLRMFADIVRSGTWVDARIDRGQGPEGVDIRRMLIPIGPVAAFGASNFPLAFSAAGGDAASAIAAGNPVVLKAHPGHPGTSEMAARVLQQAVEAAGLPPGWFSMVHATRPETSQRLVRHSAIRAVAFTGSQRAGRALFDAAASRPDPIPVHAEMGSINPVFVLPGAAEGRPEAIAETLSRSASLGVGQFCTQPGVVVGRADDAMRRLTDVFAERMGATSPGTMLHGGIRAAYERGVAAREEIEGIDLLARSEAANPSTQAGTALFRTSAATFLGRPELREELFGPSTIVVEADSAARFTEIAEELDGQLTATIHGTEDDLAEHHALIDALRGKAGRLIFNGVPTGVAVCHAMHHGGPPPATTDPRFTSVGSAAIDRFARPVCYQNFPDSALPPELRDDNPRRIRRLVDGRPEMRGGNDRQP